jgi:uncharacterized protein YjiS (DUF1127 family)
MSNTIPLPASAGRQPYDLLARAWVALPMQPMPAPAPHAASGLLASLMRMLSGVRAGWRAQRRRIATQRALLGLDDRTLRDIGIVRAEVESLAAEAHGVVAATRARMLRHALPLN